MSEITQIGAVQSRKNRTETAQCKLGKTHVDYWSSRLEKRTFKNGDGDRVEIPYWQVRIQHLRRVAYFNLKTANSTEAAAKAREIYLFLVANGWEETLAKYKPRPTQKEDGFSIEEFSDLYRETLKEVEYPPLRRTAERYIDCLGLISRTVKIDQLAQLTSPKIKEFKGHYLKSARAEGRNEDSFKLSCNALLRGAAAMFSKQMMDAYSSKGLAFQNPFTGLSIRRIELRPYTPLDRDLLDSIWTDAVKLRDGYPEVKNGSVPSGVQTPNSETSKGGRWNTPDWRDPHPEAFMILLLELGIGLRRNEADCSQWDWFFSDAKGRRYLEVRKTPFFTPKGKRRRIIPVEPVLWDAIHEWQQEGDVFIVPGNAPKIYTPEEEPINVPYRCERHHRTLVAWLRMKGINDDKPCHLLRKEFGSYVATSFGLFAAQRLLGHSSSSVTEAFYAGLTNLPELNHARVPIRQPA